MEANALLAAVKRLRGVSGRVRAVRRYDPGGVYFTEAFVAWSISSAVSSGVVFKWTAPAALTARLMAAALTLLGTSMTPTTSVPPKAK